VPTMALLGVSPLRNLVALNCLVVALKSPALVVYFLPFLRGCLWLAVSQASYAIHGRWLVVDCFYEWKLRLRRLKHQWQRARYEFCHCFVAVLSPSVADVCSNA